MGNTRENCEEIFRLQLEIQVKTFTNNIIIVLHLQKFTMVTKILSIYHFCAWLFILKSIGNFHRLSIHLNQLWLANIIRTNSLLKQEYQQALIMCFSCHTVESLTGHAVWNGCVLLGSSPLTAGWGHGDPTWDETVLSDGTVSLALLKPALLTDVP